MRLQLVADGLKGRKPDVAFEVEVPPEMREAWTAGGTIAPRISRREALQVPAVLRARNLICMPAALPIHLRDKSRRTVTGSAAPTTLFDQIDPDRPNVAVMAATYEDLLFEAESWWRVRERNFQGFPTFAEHMDRSRVFVSEAEGRVYVDGLPVPDNEVIRFYSPNPPLLVHAARAIRMSLTLDRAAANYTDNPVPLGYFSPREGVRPNEDAAAIEALLDKWEEARRRRVYGYVGAAWDLKSLQFNAEQIQLADQRQHAVLEIARAAGVDPEDLGVSTTSRTYQNSEQRRQDLLDFTLAPYLSAVEQRLSMGDVTPRGYRVKVNLDGFLRSDTKGRMDAYAVGLDVGAYLPHEIRELEDRPALGPQAVVPALQPEEEGLGA